MATLTAFDSINMDDSIFVEDETKTAVNGGIVAKTSDLSKEWDFNGANISGFQDTGGHWVVDMGTISSTQYKLGGVTFQIQGIPDASAPDVWNAFEASDD